MGAARKGDLVRRLQGARSVGDLGNRSRWPKTGRCPDPDQSHALRHHGEWKGSPRTGDRHERRDLSAAPDRHESRTSAGSIALSRPRSRRAAICSSCRSGGDAGGPSGSFYLRETDGSPPVKLGDGIAFALSPDARMVLAKLDRNEFLSLVPIGPGSPAASRVRRSQDHRGRRVPAWRHPAPRRGSRVGEGAPPALLSRSPRRVSRARSRRWSCTGRAPLRTVASWWPSHDFNEDWYVLPIDGGEQRRVPNTKALEPVGWASDGASILRESKSGAYRCGCSR